MLKASLSLLAGVMALSGSASHGHHQGAPSILPSRSGGEHGRVQGVSNSWGSATVQSFKPGSELHVGYSAGGIDWSDMQIPTVRISVQLHDQYYNVVSYFYWREDFTSPNTSTSGTASAYGAQWVPASAVGGSISVDVMDWSIPGIHYKHVYYTTF